MEHRFNQPHYNLGRFRLSVTNAAHLRQRATVPAPLLAILDTAAEKRTAEQQDSLARFYRTIAPALQATRDELAKLDKTRPQVPTVPVMVELPPDKHRDTHVLVKGNFLTPGAKVEAGTPAFLPPLPAGVAKDRLGVAQWLVSPDNPLTARVAVNRYWAQLFGTGIVETEEDFGTQGELPSNPELLDFLALEYIRLKWDTKALLREIVTSATYRQSAKVTPELLAKDPHNRLLTRGPRFRLEAEMVRDQALQVSGLLSRKMHGPSVYPPQPPGLWQAAFNGQRNWTTSTGEDKYRRGLYTFWRRTVPYPSMAAFDAPSREVCNVRRIRTNTPLQAFVTLNRSGLRRSGAGAGATHHHGRRQERRGAGTLRSAAGPGPTAGRGTGQEGGRALRDGARPLSARCEGSPGHGDRSARPAADRAGGRRGGGVDGDCQCVVEPGWRVDEGVSPCRTKNSVFETLCKLPEDVTLEEISEEIATLAAIRRAEAAAEAGKVVPPTRRSRRGLGRHQQQAAIPFSRRDKRHEPVPTTRPSADAAAVPQALSNRSRRCGAGVAARPGGNCFAASGE